MTTKLRNCIFSLTLDRVPGVRCAVVKCLAECQLDDASLQALMKNAVNDRADQVRCAAAEILGKICPDLLTEFCRLLEHPATSKSALKSLPAMVEVHGFSPFLGALESANNSDALATALLAGVKFMRDGEEDAVIALAERVRGNRVFIASLWEFAENFADKSPFFEFLDISGAKKWRNRRLVLHPCTKFAETFGSALLDLAEQFANDDTAIVRTLSAELWARLIGVDIHLIPELERLMTDNWQTCMVAAKVIGISGVTDSLRPLALRLSRDEIRNVRFSLAHHLLNTQWYDELFAETDDLEIQRLGQSQNLQIL